MEFFDKLGKKVSETYKYTTETTSKLAKEAKLKMQMNENKAKIEELYEEIGKRVYEHHIADKVIDMDIEAVVEEFCIQIDEICDRIDDERKELLTLKDKKQCPECYDEIEKACNFCPNCGFEQKDKFEESVEEEKNHNSEKFNENVSDNNINQ